MTVIRLNSKRHVPLILHSIEMSPTPEIGNSVEMGRLRLGFKLQRKNRAYMEENGIGVEMFTEEKVAADALRTIESVCPCMLRFDRGMSEEEPSISFCSPTKTGKMPKNVVEARIYHQDVKLLMDSHGFELPEYGDSINVMISYLADGRINKVDIHGFHNGRSVSVSIRRRSGDLVMTSAGTIGETGAWQSLCSGADPSAGGIFFQGLDQGGQKGSTSMPGGPVFKVEKTQRR